MDLTCIVGVNHFHETGSRKKDIPSFVNFLNFVQKVEFPEWIKVAIIASKVNEVLMIAAELFEFVFD